MLQRFDIHIQYPPGKDRYASYFESFYNLDKEEAKVKINKLLDKKVFILITISKNNGKNDSKS